MFAIVLWDDRQQKLILTRDRLGQKPLFYTQVGDDFFFASEIKALLATSRIKREIDLESMHYYLSLRFLPSPRTMLCNVNKLQPAHARFQNGAVRIKNIGFVLLR
jgi:asparagine synthase (glutamine-hydrolysing)